MLEVGRKWKANEISPLLFDIFNLTLPCTDSCPVELSHPKNCVIDYEQWRLEIEFDMKLIDTHASILTADPFIMFTEINETTLCVKDYLGPTAIVAVNNTCLLGRRENRLE